MNWPDFFNGCFEFFGACMLAMNVWQLHKDKVRKGVHWAPTIFFTTWGFYNLFFYKHIDQMWSWYGGMAIVVVNTIYLLQIGYYNGLFKCGLGLFVRRPAPTSGATDSE